MNYELSLGVPAIAVGLSAISFSASLQKDVAPIPNALAAAIKQTLLSDLVRTWYGECSHKLAQIDTDYLVHEWARILR